MFIGHFAVAFAAKKAAPRVSLGTMIFAAAFLDVIWPLLVLLGVERFRIVPGFTAVNAFDFFQYPWSHSLLMTLVWSLLFGLAYFGIRRERAAALWVALAVASHWVLDFVSHRPDLPLYPGGTARYGLSLWNSLVATFAVEGGLFAVGVAAYLGTTRALDRTGAVAWWALVLVLLALYVPGPWSPPPPNQQVVAWMGIAAVALFVPWGYWIDRHRRVVTERN